MVIDNTLGTSQCPTVTGQRQLVSRGEGNSLGKEESKIKVPGPPGWGLGVAENSTLEKPKCHKTSRALDTTPELQQTK